MFSALSCPRCGAPLPAPSNTNDFIECSFCRSTLKSDTGALSGASPTARPSWDGAVERCIEAVKASSGDDLLRLLERVGRNQLGPMGETLALRNIVANLIGDCEVSEEVSLRDDPIAVGRFMEGYLRACETLAVQDSAEINLPFLTAGPTGPMHYTRTVTAAQLAELAAREPVTPKKKGLLARLFGL